MLVGLNRVAVAIRAARAARVGEREFDRAFVERRLRDAAPGKVDRPTVQHARRKVQAVAAPEIGVAHRIEHDRLAALVRVEHVEHIARLDGEPTDFRGGIVAAQHAEPRAVVVAPAERHRSGLCQRQVEHDGQIEKDHVPVGQRDVVHHRHAGNVDAAALGQRAVGGDAVIREARRVHAHPVRVQFARARAAFRMRGERRGQAAAEVVRADRFELGGDLVRKRRLDQREDAAGVRDHAGVRDGRGQVDRSVGTPIRCLAVEGPRAHPAVAVPPRAAAVEANPVQHAVGHERVADRRAGSRVGSVTKESSGQLRRDRAHHRKVHGFDLLRRRGHERVFRLRDRRGGRHGRCSPCGSLGRRGMVRTMRKLLHVRHYMSSKSPWP